MEASPWRSKAVLIQGANPVPFDAPIRLAGTTGARLRSRSFALPRRLHGSLPPEWQATLLADHCFWLEIDGAIELPITAVRLGLTLSILGHR